MTPRLRRPSASSLALALILAAAGCSGRQDDLPREPVSGTVTMDDQPLSGAVIQFSPTGPAEKSVTGANAEITDGAFSIPREDGLVPGTYRVSISHAELKDAKVKARRKPTSPELKTTTPIPSRTKQIGPELIPARYNARSELTAEIKPGHSEGLKYALKSK